MRAYPMITTLAAIAAALIVVDGDTIRSDEERIRLEGIDAEIGHAKCEAERRLVRQAPAGAAARLGQRRYQAECAP